MNEENALFMRRNRADFIGPVYFGSSNDQTGIVNFYNSASQFVTSFQAGNATAALTYTFPTVGPASNNYLLASSTTGTLSWLNAAGTYAPIGSAFVTIGNDATLTAERALTGTANQIVVTDNGANSTVVLSTPQNIHTGASPTFAGLTDTGLTANSFLYSGASSLLTTTAAPTNGQLLIGSTGAAPVAATITQTANQVLVANGAGIITLSTPQNIHTGATPTFAGITLNGTTNISNPNLQIGGNQVFPIVQIVSATGGTLTGITNATFVVTPLTVNITPKFNTSKIFVWLSCVAVNGAGGTVSWTLERNASNLLNATDGFWRSAANDSIQVNYIYYDSPASTSQQTYALYVKAANGTTVSPNSETWSIIVIEIAQ